MIKEINELREVRDLKNSELFQKYFIQPIYKEIDELKTAYDCKTLEELATIKGKYEAHKFFIGLLKKVDEDLKIKEFQFKSDAE